MKVYALLLLFFLASCSSRQKINTEESKVTEKGSISLWANWVKDKGDKFDIQLAIENISKGDIIINLRDIRCFKGSASGRMKHTFFNTGERTIDFTEGEVKQFNLVCRLSAKAEGPYKVIINKVYDNPEKDGETRGKVIAKKIEWTHDSQ